MNRIITVAAFLFTLSCGAIADKLTETVFVAFDTETTGVNARRCRIVEIGAVKYSGETVIAATNWLINPQMPIPKGVIKVHGITDKMVEDAPDFKKVMPQFRKFIGSAPLVAHNARFDVNFVAQECRRNGLPIPTNKVIDSLKLSRMYLPQAPAHNLVALSKYLKLNAGIHHRGLEDSIYVQEMMPVIIRKSGQGTTLEDLVQTAGIPWPQFDRKEQPAATKKPAAPQAAGR